MSSSVHSVTPFAPRVAISLSTRTVSAVRAGLQLLLAQNPLTWNYIQGRHNEKADVEGPYYVIGAPSRQIADGKAILASPADLHASVPFLLSIRIKDAQGRGIPNVVLDWWQANTAGEYAFDAYTLRGTLCTDAGGSVEALSVPPGAYGPPSAQRAGHVHLIISDPAGQWAGLTTQVYVCPANDARALQTDLVNYIRAPRAGNVLRAWSVAAANRGDAYMALPEMSVSGDDREMAESVEWWNGELAEIDESMRVVAGGYIEFTLQPKRGWI